MDARAELTTSTQISDLLDRVENGEEVTITRNGRPVARLVPVLPPFNQERARAAADGLRALSKGTRLDGISIKELIEDGRRY